MSQNATANRRPVPPEPLGKLFDREPPCSIEAEMALLGSMILDPRVITDAVNIVKAPEYFYKEPHGLLFLHITALFDKHAALDLVMLDERLKKHGASETTGGADYLVKLASEVPTAANAPHFARIVAEKYRLRRVIDACAASIHDAYHAADSTVEQVIDACEQRVFEATEAVQVTEPESLAALLQREYTRLLEVEEGKTLAAGVRCGFYDIDRMLSGFQRGDFVIIAARPSIGKTSLALTLAEQIAFGTSGAGGHAEREPVAVGIVSLEMSKAALIQRLVSASSGIDSHRIRSGMLKDDEWQLVFQTCNKLAAGQVFIDDDSALTITQLRAKARRMVQRHHVGVIVLDYLQLLTSPQQARENRQVEVSAISRGLKALARELNIPIIALSQLNRGPEGRDGNKPRLSDLRESGSLEQDADVVMLMHRESYYHVGDAEWHDGNPDKANLAEIIIAKQRNGPTGSVELVWDANTTRFKNGTRGT
jgi:replicative DNA helicase